MELQSQTFYGKTVLVTGASGFIGTHLCQALFRQGARVHAVSRATHESGDYWQWWQGDLADSEVVRKLLGAIQPNIIFHLASLVTGSRDLNLVLPTFHSNLVSTVNLLTIATEQGCDRIVLTGSLEEPDTQHSEVIPCSPYAAAKWGSSAYARLFYELYQTPVVVARLFMTYGPGQKDLKKLIPYVILSLLEGRVPQLSSGQRPVDWIYVDDVVSGLLAAAHASQAPGGSFDLGSGTLVPIRMVVQQLVQLMASDIEPSFGAIPDRPLERIRVADIAHTYSGLGWQPKTALDEGLLQTIEWYRSLRQAA